MLKFSHSFNVIGVFILIYSIFLWVFSCKKESSELEVSKGNVIDFNEYPSVVRLKINKVAGSFVTWSGNCTGSVISSNTVITAAHCTNSQLNYNYYVITKNQNSEDYLPLKIVQAHPKYDARNDISSEEAETNSRTDVAIWVSSNEVFRNYPEKLQLSDVEPKVSDQVRMVGFGCYSKLIPLDLPESVGTGYESVCDRSKASEKRMGTNKIGVIKEDKSLIKLYSSYKVVDKIGSEVQEATGTSVISTSGDSGGPLLLKSQENKIIGITSGGSDTAMNKEYCESEYGSNKEQLWDCLYFSGIYANPVSSYNMPFLEKVVDDYGAIIPGVQIGIRVIEHNGKLKVLYKKEKTSFNEKVEEHKIIKTFNNAPYKAVSSLKQAWRNTNFYERSKASWSFE